MFQGYSKRLIHEYNRKNGFSGRMYRCITPDTGTPDTTIWLGGKLVASVSDYLKFVTKEEYEEHGYNIISKKCVT